MTFNQLILTCLAYVALLFFVAFAAERRAIQGQRSWTRSPLVYTLSLSVYCTAWTFYGAVGAAVRSGLEFVTIYLGPTLVMLGWWLLLRKLVRVGKTQRSTSIADLISSRYGKSNGLGVVVTMIAVVGTTPYIALQLQSVSASFDVFAGEAGTGDGVYGTSLWVAAGLTLFTILFGTRNLNSNERHHGVVIAIAVEAVVKLLALVLLGCWVIWGLGGGPEQVLDKIATSEIAEWKMDGGRWVTLVALSAAAILCLPRMFQVLVVENEDEAHLATASWAFPLYLLCMSLFVLPIAVVGLDLLPPDTNPDHFVLSLPLAYGQDGLALLAFLGGFSSATSMVIVAAIALSTMVSNHIVMPMYLARRGRGLVMAGDVRQVVIRARRLSIAGVLGLGYLYHQLSDGRELAAIGLIAFAGVAQVLPALLGGLFWRGATRSGAAAGLITGFVIWAYCLFLPSFGAGGPISAAWMEAGPAGIGILRPQALFGIDGLDPLVHAMFWSMLLNTFAFCAVSITSFPDPMERLQGAQVVNVFQHTSGARGWAQGAAETEDLLMMAQRILGPGEAQALFQREARAQGKAGYLPDPTADFLGILERELAGSVGSATAHAMVGQIAGGTAVRVEDLMRVADEAQQIMEYSARLEETTAEQARTAAQLQRANEKLTELSIQKDAFLSQVSHELRTPMTSIRAFSEILKDTTLKQEERARFAGVIHDEALRLTRLLDDLLHLSVLENAPVPLNLGEASLSELIDRAIVAAGHVPIAIDRRLRDEQIVVSTDTDRLVQVFLNVVNNAAKYCQAPNPVLRIRTRVAQDEVQIDFIDNGAGIPAKGRDIIFEKFSRLDDSGIATSGAGLGLAICKEIMTRLEGRIAYLPGQSGAAFRVSLPARARAAA